MHLRTGTFSFSALAVCGVATAVGLLATPLISRALAPKDSAPVMPAPTGSKHSALVLPRGNGLEYRPYTAQGDTLADFSNCGYGGGGVALPSEVVAVAVTLEPEPGTGDDLPRLQAAIDRVSKLPENRNGFRGAVLLRPGTYRLSAPIQITASGVVLRGSGADEKGTVLLGTTRKSYNLIAVRGASGVTAQPETRQAIRDAYVPVGARTFTVADGANFRAGDHVLLVRHGNDAWIHELGMDRITPSPSAPESTQQWKAFDLNFDRVVTAVEGNRITLDAPLTCAVDARWGGGDLVKYTDSGRIEKVGVENLYALCEFDRNKQAKNGGVSYLSDEDHVTTLVTFDNVKNAWARDLSTRYLQNVVEIKGGAKWVTVQDCWSVDPVSILTGSRRYTYYINGQLCLVQRCFAREARHAFVVGSRVTGPNVFLDCRSEKDYATSEPHHRWSVGGLYDNIASEIAFQDRQWYGTGHGWAGANYVAWNCTGMLIAQKPPTAQNFAIGFVGKRQAGAFPKGKEPGWWESEGQHVTPRSLYLTQLRARLGEKAVAAVTAPTQQVADSASR